VIEFRLLGGFEVINSDVGIPLGHARQQCVLVALLADANRPLPVDQLIQRVWGEGAPQRARNTLHSYLTRLRHILAGSPGTGITHRSGCYTLMVDESSIDVNRFRSLIAQAGVEKDARKASIVFDHALGLWRGEVIAGLETPWTRAFRSAVEHERQAAVLDAYDAKLRCGDHVEVLTRLFASNMDHPFNERLTAQLMLALYRSGRPSDALTVYRETWRRLDDELGVEPGPTLQQFHQAILTGDLELNIPDHGSTPSARIPRPVILRGSDRTPSPQAKVERAELYRRLAHAFSSSGEFHRSWHSLLEIVTLSSGEPIDIPADVSSLASALERHLGRDANARGLLNTHLSRILSGNPATTRTGAAAVDIPGAHLALELCYQDILDRDSAKHRRHANLAVALSKNAEDIGDEAAALAQLSLACYFDDDVEAALTYRAQAAALIDQSPDRLLRKSPDACCFLAWSESYLQLFPEAHVHASRVHDLVPADRPSFSSIQAWVLQASVCRSRGDLIGAARCVDSAMAQAQSTGSTRWRMTVLALQCEIATVRGDLALAASSGGEALRLATDPRDRKLVRHVPATLAAARFIGGAPQGCVDEVLSAFGGPDLAGLDSGTRPRGFETLVWMDLLLGNGARAQVWATRAMAAADLVPLPCSQGFAFLARAQAQLSSNPDVAWQASQHAAARFKSAGARYEEGRAVYAGAFALSGLGRITEAETALATASEIIGACGGGRMLSAG
jgi:DNA-binding SARP family transcriptional activator